ncbi:MAG: aldehyde dehydrogenase family protein, partial [Eubacterium sp.]
MINSFFVSLSLIKGAYQNEEQLLSALHHDLGKSAAESYMTELSIVYGEIREAVRKIRWWSLPKPVLDSVGTFPSQSFVYPEPYGTALIITPWNYPVNLSLAPLTAAIAAGNCAVVKCSRQSVRTSQLLRNILNHTFPDNYIYCTEGDIDYDELLEQRYDYIFFTGSPRVGKTVMQAASKYLTPVSLELGGKSPCIIDESADLKLAAKRAAWGKLLNAGQTCIAVDYVLVQNRVKEPFLKALEEEIDRSYPDPLNNDSYPCIISRRSYDRLVRLIGTEESVIGGEADLEKHKIAPAIFPDTDFDHEIMKGEIFGPLLPVIGYDHLDQAIREVKTREKPLACYIFTKKKKQADKVIHELSYGGGCVNDVIMHNANGHLPFGGVGNSGMGAYHGKYGFDAFSHKKAVLKSITMLDLPFRYPPFDEKKLKLLKKLL